MKDELIKALKALTIGQAEETFHSDYDSFDDEASDKIKAREDLDAYCKGVNDVLNILETLDTAGCLEDVVECSKIDKAIEEIDEYRQKNWALGDMFDCGMTKAIKILKRNIA